MYSGPTFFFLGEPFSTLKFREQHVLAVDFLELHSMYFWGSKAYSKSCLEQGKHRFWLYKLSLLLMILSC